VNPVKKSLCALLVMLVVFACCSCSLLDGGETTGTETGTSPSATNTVPATTAPAQTETTTAASTAPPVTTTKAATTQPTTTTTTAATQPASTTSANYSTYTGYAPLPERTLKVTDPDNTRGLSVNKNGYDFGLAPNAQRPQVSVNHQKYFDSKGFNALSIDIKHNGKILYLTFDCGYENGYTEKILDTLKAKKVPSAFFCTLSFIKDQPAIAARMIKEGHILGNHSATHGSFPDMSRTEMALEIQQCDNYLRRYFGYSEPYFRFPAGEYSDCALDLVSGIGYQSVFWSVAYADWDPANQKGRQFAFDTVTSRLHPGAVILLHAVSKDNAAALGDIIDWARQEGYEFRSLRSY